MSLEQTVDNLEIRYANAVTFVGTSNTMIDTTTGRIQTKGIQHNSNVITDVSGPHGRVAPTLKKYPEIVFEEGKFDRNDTTNTYTQAGYTVTASTQYDPNYAVHHTFNDVLQDIEVGAGGILWTSATSTYPASGGFYVGTTYGIGTTYGEFIKLELPNKIKPKEVRIFPRTYQGGGAGNAQSPAQFKIFGSNDNFSSEIVELYHQNTDWVNNETWGVFDISHTTHFKHFGIVFTKTNGTNIVGVQEIEYYGYEEYTPAGDHSVDTTFMSRFNNPQTTGVQVLVDGATGVGTNQISGGPDPSGNQSTYVTDGKYWTLNGTLTSNLAVEANTFLEGDQPHAVSVWFNSSNLEANVSNTCVFSISDQEKLDSINLDLQSNTWHNLTYAYQGEGGSRVTYLDGRKVAEDQAEDTFGEYPPFPMTGYSQGGYVVSASSEMSGYDVWKGFGEVGTHFISSDSSFDGGDDTFNSINGPWVKITLPYKIKLSYLQFYPRNNFPNQLIQDGTIYASNDDISWVQIGQLNNLGNYTNSVPAMVSFSHNTCYNSYLLHITQNVTNYVSFENLRFYGHRENDLVRLPDPTNVLKYPHIPLTNYPDRGGPGRRGYVATTSGAPNPAYAAQHAFNGVTVSGEGSWHSYAYYETTGGRLATRTPTSSLSSWTANGGSTTGELTTHTGEWLKIQLPHKIVLSSIILKQRTGVPLQKVRLFSIVGSNDDTNWFLVHQELTRSGTSTSLQEPDPNTMTGSYSNTAFKYFAIVIHAGVTDNTYDHVAIGEWELYGTEENSSIPIQIGGGNIDKVANFRVYDKFIDENQALEIWDAQKDAFGRAKSSMTLQKGRLGIGTTEPEGRLAVLDEPHNLEEFPPRPMTGYKNYFEGHGVFKASASSYYTPETLVPWNAFDHVSGTRWATSDTAAYTSGVYTGSANFTTNGGYVGEWIQLEVPYPIKLSHVMVNKGVSVGRAPEAGYILGSNNGVEWNVISNFTGKTYSDRTFTRIEAPATSAYRYLRMVVTNVIGGTMVDITEIRYFGTREQGQSVLHDGQLTLTKNLTVPRIGPALDADDTPRRDRLVVEYNTSTNPTFEGAVRDTSGRGLDGALIGGATYDATGKAFEFPNNPADNSSSVSGKDSIITHGIPGTRLNTQMTVSTWLRLDSPAQWEQIWGIGSSTTAYLHSILFVSNGALSYQSEGGGGAVNYPYTYTGWNHVTIVRNSATFNDVTFYVNGSVIGSSSTSGTGTMIQPDNIKLTIGGAITQNHYWLDGAISNFKLYDTALTAEEVKTLYDMGRNGSVANPQPLHIAAPLYAPGSIVQVEQSIKTDTFSTNGAGTHPVSPGNDVPGLAVTIHPKFANSKILVSYTVSTGAYGRAYLRIQRKQGGVTTNIEAPVGPEANTDGRGKATTSHSGSGDSSVNSESFEYYDAAGGTEPITYQIQAWTYHATYYIYVNRAHVDGNGTDNGTYWARTLSSITAREVCQ